MSKRLTRQILYNKASGTAALPEKQEKKATPKKEEKPILKPNSASLIAQWIKSHEFFKWSGMCRKLGIAPGNFWRGINTENPVIPEKHLTPIIKTLKQYGYAP
jgi:hypothetical protein